jgi:hypothetical protein
MRAIAQQPATIKCDKINVIGKEPRTMLPKREIKAKDFVNDLRSGMSDSELRGKYNLSAQGLQSAFKKLLEAKAVRTSELFGRVSLQDDTVAIATTRLFPRDELDFPFPIYLCEGTRPTAKGVIKDITEKGLKVSGIEVKVDEVKTFAIPSDKFSQVDPFAFRAICRWVDEDGCTGFQITQISKRGSGELEKLIRFLTLKDANL